MAEPSQTILIVDDEHSIRTLLSAVVDEFGYNSVTAANGTEALAKISTDIDVVLCDVNMTGMDGYEVVRRIRNDAQLADIRIIQVTAISDQESRLTAVQAGANDFIAKPVDLTELRVRLDAQLKIKSQQDAIRRHHAELEQKVDERTAQLQQALANMDAAHLDTIRRLSIAAEYKDEDTANHVDRVSRYCQILATALGLPHNDIEVISHAAPMHDIGKMGVPDAILLKPGKLTPDEWVIMKNHTIIGGRILANSTSPLIEAGRIIALSHHEKWDGTGYPAGLVGTAIPIMGRICAVADVFDALTTARPYKEAFSNEKAYAIIREGHGTHFDPAVVDAFFASIHLLEGVQTHYSAH